MVDVEKLNLTKEQCEILGGDFSVIGCRGIEILPLKESFSDKEMDHAEKIAREYIGYKDMGTAFVSTDALPGLKILAQEPSASKKEAVIVFSPEFSPIYSRPQALVIGTGWMD